VTDYHSFRHGESHSVGVVDCCVVLRLLSL